MQRRVYLDYSSTTPVDERVLSRMLPYLAGKFGNASSVHFFGQEARAGVDLARRQVADLINAKPNDIVFTSGGTEANNLAIRGVCETYATHGRHIVTSNFEHAAVRETIDALEKRGWRVTRLPVYENGIVRVEDVEKSIESETILVSVMMVNNEIGTLQPIKAIGDLIKAKRQEAGKRNIFFHTDAVQAAGRLPIDVETLGCDLLALSAHKIYAPKGVGALYVRRSVKLERQNTGGHQERERRGGTESVPLIVAFGEAARLAKGEQGARFEFTSKLRDKFESEVAARIPDVIFNGDRTSRAPHVSNISFGDIEGESVLINLDLQGIAVSTGSACSSGSIEPSPVLLALGRTRDEAHGAIRFSFGKDLTEEDLTYVLDCLPRAVEVLRRMSPQYQAGLKQN